MSRRAVESLEARLGELDVSLFAKDAAGTKAATTALQSEAARRPRACMAALPALEAALGDDNYAKRSAVVHVLATLAEQIAEAARSGQALKDAPLDADPDAEEGGPRLRDEADDSDADIEEESEDEELSEEEAAAKAAAKAAGAASAAQQTQADARSRIIALLHARIHDINSFTRIRALQQLTALVRGRAITDAGLYVATMRAGQDRLMDKTASVRKAAIQLLTATMEMNPFSAVLDLALFRAQLATKAHAFRQQCERVPALAAAAAAANGGVAVRAPIAEGREDEREPGADDSDDSSSDESSERKQKMDEESKEDGEAPSPPSAAQAPPASLKALLSSAIVSDLALERSRTELQALFHAVGFVTTLAREVLPVLHELLLSKTHSDAIECVHFFVAAKQFQLGAPVDATEDPQNEGAGEDDDEDEAAAASPAAARKAQAQAQGQSPSQSLLSTRVTVESGLKKLAGLIWSREETVRDAVLAAWVGLYLSEDLSSRSSAAAAKKAALVSTHSLVSLVLSGSLADLTNMEEICTRLFYAGHIPPVLVKTLWELFSSPEEVSAQARAAFLTLLTYFANASGQVLSHHVSELVSVGFSDAALISAPVLVRSACIALQKWVAAIKAAPTPAEAPAAIPAHALEAVYPRLRMLLLSTSAASVPVAQAWYSGAEAALNTLFLLHPDPERYCESLLHELAAEVFAPSTASAASPPHPHALGNAEKLARFLFLLAHTALRTLVHLETLEKEIKLLRNKAASAPAQVSAETEPEEEAATVAPKKRGGKKAAASAAAASAPMATSIEDDLAANQAAEYELEQLREQAENELVQVHLGAKGLVSVWGPVVVQLVQNLPAYAAHPSVQVNAVLALCKFMCVNVAFCEGIGSPAASASSAQPQPHLSLLFGVLKSPSTCATIKGNVIVALGDLFLRFPNSVEPWSEHMYHGLERKAPAAVTAATAAKGKAKNAKASSSAGQSPSQQQDADESYVRKNTLMVLTHLILNDMLKAKGPLAEIAKCTQDSSGAPRIAQLSRAFFQELNGKCGDSKATIYNMLPDILSRLSSDATVSPAAFREVFRFLLGFLSQQKQVDSLVEKILTRFELQRDEQGGDMADVPAAAAAAPVPAVVDGEAPAAAAAAASASASASSSSNGSSLCRDLSYCLTQLSLSLASLKKLSTLFRCYAPKLGDEVTYANFVAVLARARKSLVGKDGAKDGEVGGGVGAAGKEKDALEAKQLCDELDARLAGQHEKMREEAATTSKARAARGKRGYGERIPGEEERRVAAPAAAAGGEESEEEEEEEEAPKPAPRGGRGKAAIAAKKPAAAAAPAKKKAAAAAPAKPTRGRKKAVSSDDEESSSSEEEDDDESVDEESEEEEEETKPAQKKKAAAAPAKKKAAPAPAAKKAPAKAPAKGRKKKVVESSEDDDDDSDEE